MYVQEYPKITNLLTSMCGILACISDGKLCTDRKTVLELSKKLRHRGPDWNGVHLTEKAAFAHERLAIVDPSSGDQPLFSKDKRFILCANGEIYNHLQLKSEVSYEFSTGSDCEVILPLFMNAVLDGSKSAEVFGDICNSLHGVFAFIAYDSETGVYLVARDAIGVVPLYYGYSYSNGKMSIWFSSEMKALTDVCYDVKEFLPGSMCLNGNIRTDPIPFQGGFAQWYNPRWSVMDKPSFDYTDASFPGTLEMLKTSLENSVVDRLMTDVPYGVLLSGGLDSSLVASIVNKHRLKRIESGEKDEAWWPKLHSFCIGLKGSPDLKAAREVADFLGTTHHEMHFTVQEGLDALEDVIYHIETFDVTTIRASTPMYLLARKIKSFGIKMVLSGEGADEIFGGYLYFHKAPNSKEFQEELVRKLQSLHYYDCLRANKSMMAWGIETRVPFLDKNFLDVAMGIDAKLKMPSNNIRNIEKHILRQAFTEESSGYKYLPDSVLWRQKEQFSDGVGYSWIDSLKECAEKSVSDSELEEMRSEYPNLTTKEAVLYYIIFKKHFPKEYADKTIPKGPSIACSTATAVKWDKEWETQADPSGRAINVHVESINE